MVYNSEQVSGPYSLDELQAVHGEDIYGTANLHNDMLVAGDRQSLINGSSSHRILKLSGICNFPTYARRGHLFPSGAVDIESPAAVIFGDQPYPDLAVIVYHPHWPSGACFCSPDCYSTAATESTACLSGLQ